MKNMSMTNLIAAAALGVLEFVLCLSGATISASTGIPAASGAINALIGGAFDAFCALLIGRFGAVIVMETVFSILAIPLPLEGTPGFFPKILIGISIGVLADTVYALLKKRERLAAVAIGASTQSLTGLLIIGLGTLFALPGIEESRRLFLSPVVFGILVVYGGAAGFLGWILFKKLRDTPIATRIRGRRD